VPPDYHLGPDAEKTHYDNHRNIVDDPGYRMFLQRLAQPLIEQLAPASRGLDFGCGPGPALADILQQAGFSVQLYDLYYYPDNSVLDSKYDFITATEVIEHLAQPWQTLQMLWQLLQPGGTLGLMTKQVIDRRRFANWHYIRDPTHIAFYSRGTMIWLAERLDAELEWFGDDVVLLRKPPGLLS
jgi:2-polyprenyl-3-methyl-5-hydroxy-6-metoxy-1,4-benzoquinol methylase